METTAANGGSVAEAADRRQDEIIALARRFIERHSATSAQSALLRTVLLETRGKHGSKTLERAVFELPLLVYAATGGEEEEPLPLALAATLVDLGIRLLDHIADRELAPHWRGQPPAAVQVAAVGFLCALPQLAVSELAATPARIAGLHRTLAEQFVQIGLGQQIDIELTGTPRPSLDEVDAAVAGKTGERWALYARLAAQLAGAPEAVSDAYAATAREYGIARQLVSDCGDIAAGEGSRDLANGTRTWPVAWLLNRLRGEARRRFVELLDRARSDHAARREARRILIDKGALTRTLIEAHLRRDAALRALDRARPREPAAAMLRAMVADVAAGQKKNDRARPSQSSSAIEGATDLPSTGGTGG